MNEADGNLAALLEWELKQEIKDQSFSRLCEEIEPYLQQISRAAKVIRCIAEDYEGKYNFDGDVMEMMQDELL